MELYRKELKIAVIKGLDESRGSSNVPIKLTHDTSDEYINYTEQIHIRYLFDNQLKEEILPTNDNGFYIPGKPLSHDGPIELAVHLINGDIELVTNELSFVVKNAPNGTTQVDPSEFTWQQLVDQYVNAKLETFADKADMNKFKDDVNANLSNQDKKITDLQNTTKVSLDSQNTKITTLEGRMDTFTRLSDGSTTGDAELQDIRVGANGTTYDTAGNAVRGQYSQLKEDLGELYVGNPITRKKVPKNWANGYIDTSGNLIANNTGYITQELISFDEDGYTYSLKDTFEGFTSQFKLWVFIYDLSGNYVRGRNESYAVSNLGNAPKPDTQHKYRFMLTTVNWETFSDSNINADKANTILQIKKEIQTPYAKKENLNKTDENVSALDGRVTTLENKGATLRTWKKWNAIGDSITYLDGYEPIVKNALGIESYTNNGQSGFSTPMIGKSYIDSMSDDYDLITFFMGTNNFGRCNSIEETKTSCDSIFSAMADKWQTSDIAIILPIQRWGYTGDDVRGPQSTMTNSDGITLRDYCLAIKEIAEKYSFFVLDGYYRSGIIGGENGNTSNYLNDGLHPNDKGNELIANMIVKFLKANF